MAINSQQLHRHTLPLILLALGLVVVTVYQVNKIEGLSYTPNDKVNLLVNSHIFTVKTSTSGLFKISRYQTQSALLPSAENEGKLSQVENLGQISL